MPELQIIDAPQSNYVRVTPRVPMGIYTIGNDGFTLCRETPTAVNEGEIVVASNEKLHADRLSGKRLLPLWTARLDIESRRMGG